MTDTIATLRAELAKLDELAERTGDDTIPPWQWADLARKYSALCDRLSAGAGEPVAWMLKVSVRRL